MEKIGARKHYSKFFQIFCKGLGKYWNVEM